MRSRSSRKYNSKREEQKKVIANEEEEERESNNRGRRRSRSRMKENRKGKEESRNDSFTIKTEEKNVLALPHLHLSLLIADIGRLIDGEVISRNRIGNVHLKKEVRSLHQLSFLLLLLFFLPYFPSGSVV